MTAPKSRSPNQRIVLTQARVARLRAPPSGRLTVHDAVLPGLSVRITMDGVTTFSNVKRVAGRPIRVTLGRFPALTVDKARRLASGHLGDMAGGINPNQMRREQEALRPPLRAALDEYRRTREDKATPKTLSEYTRMLESYRHDRMERRVQAATGHYMFPGPGCTGHLVEWKKGAAHLRTLSKLPNWIVYDLRRTYLASAEGLDLAPYALKALVNHKQPDSDVTGGYLRMSPDRLRKPAQLVEDKLLRLAQVNPGADVLEYPTPRDRDGPLLRSA